MNTCITRNFFLLQRLVVNTNKYYISFFDISQWLSSMSMFFNSWLSSNALITDEANSKHCVLRESNVRRKSRTRVTRFLFACFTFDLTSAYEFLVDEISSDRLCQKSGWYRAVLQCLQVDDAATLDSGNKYVNIWWRARLGRAFQSTGSILTENNGATSGLQTFDQLHYRLRAEADNCWSIKQMHVGLQ